MPLGPWRPWRRWCLWRPFVLSFYYYSHYNNPMIIYNLLLTLLAIFALPVVLYRVIVKKKYRASIWQRLGFGFPIIEKGDRSVIWIHAVSVGETKAVVNLA